MKNTNISVKKVQSYCIPLLFLLLCSNVSAKVNNYLGAYATLAEWSMMPAASDYSTSFGVTGGVGGLYELQAGPTYKPTRFLLDVGVGAFGGMSAFLQSTSSTVSLLNQTDLQGDQFDYIYEIKDRHDAYNTVALQVPVMIGVQHRAFYMLAGVKLNYFLYTKTRSTALLTTYGHYDNVIGRTGNGDFRNMPVYQFFNDRPVRGGVKTNLNFDMALSFEIGGRIGILNEDAFGYDVPKRKIEYRLAAFVDYGLLDIHVAGNKDLLELPGGYDAAAAYNPDGTNTSMLDNVVMNDIMSTRVVKDNGTVKPFASMVNSFMVGLKFTVLFQMPEAGQCVICRDSYRSSARRASGRRGMKYEE